MLLPPDEDLMEDKNIRDDFESFVILFEEQLETHQASSANVLGDEERLLSLECFLQRASGILASV